MKILKVKEVLELLQKDGWYELKGHGGDHRQFKHPEKKGRVTVRGHLNDTLDQFLLNSIFKQAGWK
jgi:predicted RNA binding protein YcfA (HicA-like mRNA interferase family)